MISHTIIGPAEILDIEIRELFAVLFEIGSHEV